MRTLLTILFVFLSQLLFSQSNFKKGYYISNSNDKIEGFISHSYDGALSNIKFKESESANAKVLTISNVKEFVFSQEEEKYIKFKVNFDNTSDLTRDLKAVRSPELTEGLLFLKEEAIGEINLYSYINGVRVRCFIKKGDQPIEQLIFKKYLTSASGDNIAYNVYYKQQLLNIFSCELIDAKVVANVDYRIKDLTKVIAQNNNCDLDYKYVKKKGKGKVNVSIRPGIKSTKLSIDSGLESFRNTEFDSEFVLRYGIELEYLFNRFNKDWAIVLEPNYHKYSNNGIIDFNGVDTTVEVEYSGIELAFGPRYYFDVSSTVKPFVNALYSVNITETGKIQYSSFSDLKTKSNPTLVVGAGAEVLGSFVAEIQYYLDKEISVTNGIFNSNYSNIVFIVGYKF